MSEQADSSQRPRNSGIEQRPDTKGSSTGAPASALTFGPPDVSAPALQEPSAPSGLNLSKLAEIRARLQSTKAAGLSRISPLELDDVPASGGDASAAEAAAVQDDEGRSDAPQPSQGHSIYGTFSGAKIRAAAKATQDEWALTDATQIGGPEDLPSDGVGRDDSFEESVATKILPELSCEAQAETEDMAVLELGTKEIEPIEALVDLTSPNTQDPESSSLVGGESQVTVEFEAVATAIYDSPLEQEPVSPKLRAIDGPRLGTSTSSRGCRFRWGAVS